MTATSCSRPATASSLCSALRWRRRIIRNVRCTLRYGCRLREVGDPPLEARVGINTGEAVVRSIKTGDAHTEYTPIGHSTSLASRMQTLAPTGSIAVTEITQKLCAGYFAFKALGPARVKGVTEPVSVFEVTGLGPLRTRLQRAA